MHRLNHVISYDTRNSQASYIVQVEHMIDEIWYSKLNPNRSVTKAFHINK